MVSVNHDQMLEGLSVVVQGELCTTYNDVHPSLIRSLHACRTGEKCSVRAREMSSSDPMAAGKHYRSYSLTAAVRY